MQQLHKSPGVKKKDKTGIIICPRCGAENMVVQSSCGRCGFVFPKDKVVFKGDRGEEAFGGTAQNTAGTPTSASPFGSQTVQKNGSDKGDGETDAQKSAPSRPKHLPEAGAREGVLHSRGEWSSCPRCGADMKADAKRCIKCGYRPAIG